MAAKPKTPPPPKKVKCKTCGAEVPDEPFCAKCGAPPKAEKRNKFEIEVDYASDKDGNYTFSIQLTEDGKGKQVPVQILDGSTSLELPTDANGHAEYKTAVKNTEKFRRMVFRFKGTQAEKQMSVPGPKAPLRSGVGFWENLKNRVKFNRERNRS